MSSLIIDEPSLQSLRQRYAYSLLTFIFWALWIYLWLPLISLVAWLVGVNLFYEQMIEQNGYQAFLQMALRYALVVWITGSMLLGWAGYNLFRFRGKERRKSLGVVEKADIARHFGVEVDRLDGWRGAKRLTIHHNDRGGIDRVEA